MKVTRHDDDGKTIWFPMLMVHKDTNCVALFSRANTYTIIDQGDQVKKVGEVVQDVDFDHEKWQEFKGFINLKNG